MKDDEADEQIHAHRNDVPRIARHDAECMIEEYHIRGGKSEPGREQCRASSCIPRCHRDRRDEQNEHASGEVVPKQNAGDCRSEHCNKSDYVAAT